MEVSHRGIELIKRHEGCVLKAYRCPAGVLTIGYGHTRNVHSGEVISETQAERYLLEDLKPVAACVGAAVKTDISQNMFDALCSFTFNVGCDAFLRSTLLKIVNISPDDKAIKGEFCKWVYGNGKILPGLVRRRREEAELYFE